MNSDLPESLEDRIAPASLVDAMAPAAADESPAANGVGMPAEQPFFGPASAGAVDVVGAPPSMSSTSVSEGRAITNVPASSISPVFIDALSGSALSGLDASLAFRGLLENDSARAPGIHDILSDGAVPSPDTLGLAQSAALSALTTVAGLASPVLLVDVPKIDRAL